MAFPWLANRLATRNERLTAGGWRDARHDSALAAPWQPPRRAALLVENVLFQRAAGS